MIEVIQIPALEDNYIYLIHDTQHSQTGVIDPTEAEPVQRTLSERGWKLTHIFNTHHHWDHVGANLTLKEQYGCSVLGSQYDAKRIPGIDHKLKDGDNITFGSEKIKVLFTPGHTSGHICYYLDNTKALFSGDTLFSMGCGRLFEGTPEEMFASMKIIRKLPADTKIYCAHEYTQSNGHFALSLEPNNITLQNRMKKVLELRQNNLPTVPSTLKMEMDTNPFLRWGSSEIRQCLQMPEEEDSLVFKKIRERKDNF